MKKVTPDTKTTLVLNAHYLPILVITARLAFNHVLCGRAKAMDKFGNLYDNIARDKDGKPKRDTYGNYIECHENNFFDSRDQLLNYTEESIYYEDQPYFNSASQIWAIPSIIVVHSNYFKTSTNSNVSLKELAKKYNYTCQICGKRFPLHKLTKEHVYPKSKGGDTSVYNILPTCKTCNSMKGDIYPYYDKDGNLLEKKIKKDTIFLRVDAKDMRKEWNIFLFKNNK